MRIQRWTMIFVLAGLIGWPAFALADMTSTNYKIQWDTVSAGGNNTSSSSSYNLRDTVSGNAIGSSTSASYQDNAGYRAGVNDQTITYDLFAESPSSQVAANALAGTTVTVADTAGFSVGNFAAVVENVGAGQVAAIGKITSKTSTTLVFDTLSNGGTAPTVDGTNDAVFLLSGTSASLGTLSASTVATEIIGFNVTADVDNGYTIQAMSDGNLRSGANSIANVTDGTVTAGVSEYGGHSSDTTVTGSTFGTQDTAFSTSFQPVVDRSGHQFEDRNFLTLKAAMASSTPSGSYAQTLTLVVSGNF